MPAGVGVTLRSARVRAGVQLSDVQAQTGIKAKYLRALEWERFDLLPNFEYARRVAQAQARVLHLDLDATVAELDRTVATLPRHGPTVRPESESVDSAETLTTPIETAPVADAGQIADPPFVPPPLDAPTPERDAELDQRPVQPRWSEPTGVARTTSRIPTQARRLLVGALLGGLAAFLIVDLLVLRDEGSSDAPTTASQPEAAEPALEPEAPVEEGVVEDPTSDAGAGGASGDAEPDSTADAGVEPGAGAGAAAGAEGGSADEPAPAGVSATDQGGPSDPSTASEPAGDAAIPAGVQRIEITTPRGQSWLQIRQGSRTGPVLYEGIPGSGETLTFEERKLFARVGAISAVDIRQDGSLISEGLEGTLDVEISRAKGLRVVS